MSNISDRKFSLLGYTALGVLIGGFGIWATATQIAGAIVAPGRIEVDQNRQVVQHLDGGVVAQILVDEGDTVAAGDALIQLDDEFVTSELSIIENQLFELMARRARLEAERDDANITWDEELFELAKTRDDVADFIDGQGRLFMARADTVKDQINQLYARKKQDFNLVEGIQAQQASLDKQLVLIKDELESQKQLLEKGLTQARTVLSLERTLAELEGRLGELKGREAATRGRIAETEIEIVTLVSTRREEAITQLRDIQNKEIELAEKRRALQERIKRMRIAAPTSGVVYGLTVFAEKSVIRPGDDILYVVPQDRPLLVSSRVDPNHIDQVHAGQTVSLRFSTLDQRQTPELFGIVTHVSADAFDDERNGTSYYKAEVTLSEGEVARLPEGVDLVPGMPVEAYLRTEDRTPLAYLTKPLTDYFVRAFRE